MSLPAVSPTRRPIPDNDLVLPKEPAKKPVLFVDDDEDDFHLLRDLFKEVAPQVELHWAKDGEEAMARLLGQGVHANLPRPYLILLDLNMPKLNGREVLRQIRSTEYLRHVPVVVMTNSMNKEEALDVYRLGVNSFIRKPSGFAELREFTRVFSKYWFEYSTLL